MSSLWPGAFDTLNIGHQNNVGEPVDANDIDKLAAIVMQLQQILGINPQKGTLPSLYADVVSRLNALDNPPVNYQNNISGYTFVLADLGHILNMFSTTLSSMTVTIPPHSSVPFPLGASLLVRMAGTAVVNFAAGTGVTLTARGGATQIAGRYGYAQLLQVAALDAWDLTGDVS